MISRFLLAVCLAALMVVSSVGSYIYLGGRQSKIAAPPQKPTAASPRPQALTLPGRLYLVQSGAIYTLNAGRFRQLTPEDGWTQPALYPDGSAILAVRRSSFYSDVYILNRFGSVVGQLTNNAAPARQPDTGSNHWSFYPRLTPDEGTMFMSYDSPKLGYNVSMSIWSVPLGGSIRQGRMWTDRDWSYTGGDVQPLPLASGNVLYTRYDYGPDTQLISQIWITNRAGSLGRALTTPEDDCREPSLSPDGRYVAMICTYEKQVSYLVVASFDGDTIGPFSVLITDQLVAQPTWAPDGSGIAYLAPGTPDSPFQLWWLPKAAYSGPPPSPVPTPSPGGPYNGTLPSPTPIPPPPPIKPVQMTTNLAFDATSPLAWSA
jgi:Tol biopolymer transport system component